MFGVTISGSLSSIIGDEVDEIKSRLTDAVRECSDAIKSDLRDDIQSGLGRRAANMISVRNYPDSGSSMRAAADIFVRGKASKAERWRDILEAYSSGGVITGKNGWLAIPTQNVPKTGRGNRALSVDEVEARLGRLTFVPSGRVVLVFAGAIAGKSGGWRRETAGRLSQGRTSEAVLMFVLVKQVRVRKRLDMRSIIQKWESEFPARIEAALMAGG